MRPRVRDEEHVALVRALLGCAAFCSKTGVDAATLRSASRFRGPCGSDDVLRGEDTNSISDARTVPGRRAAAPMAGLSPMAEATRA